MATNSKADEIRIQNNTIPVFADEVLIKINFKESKTRHRTAIVRLQFLDLATKRVMSEVVIDTVTAEGLQNVLKTRLEDVQNVLKSKNLEKEAKKLAIPVKSTEDEETVYMG